MTYKDTHSVADVHRSGEFNIRLANRGDIAQIAAFNCAMARETEGRVLDQALVQQGVAGILEKPQYGFYLVAEWSSEGHVAAQNTLGDTPLAACSMLTYEWSDWRNGVFWWLQSVYVAPPARRRGVFTALYRDLERRARESADSCGLRLYVERENRRAQATYEKLGMLRDNYYIYELDFGQRDSGVSA